MTTPENTGKDQNKEDLKKTIENEHAGPSESANNYSRGSNVSGVAADDQENWSRDHKEGEMTGQDEVLKAADRIENLKKDSNSRNTKMDEESPRGEKIDPEEER
ncbi:MAG TPA: hypothetical protein VGE26_10905 [Sphingobacteriaceae bacterium]